MNPHQRKATSGFTLVELLVAAAIGAALIASAVIGFGVISNLPLREGTVNVSLPSGVIGNFYGTNFASLTLGPNPNYFQAAQARRMKDRLISDVSAASAKYGVSGLQYTVFGMLLAERQLAVGTGSLPVSAAALPGAR